MTKVKFGFQNIDESKKPEKVNGIFSSVSNKYDLMNDIMSFGLHRIWKKQFIKLCDLQRQKKILDVACGTGDITIGMLKSRPDLEITCLDPSDDMMNICKSKLIDSGYTNVDFQTSSIEGFKPKDNTFDLVTLAFGFRNFSNNSKALKKILNTLKPGGSLIIMDFKKPTNKNYASLFKFYTLEVIPKIGSFIASDSDSYRYLGESIQTYYTPEEISIMLKDTGYINIKSINLLEDVVSIHKGYKS